MTDRKEFLSSFIKAMLDRDMGTARKILHSYVHHHAKALLKESETHDLIRSVQGVDESQQIYESAPPDMEDWVKKNKAKFKKEYGEKKGLEILYATAWKMHDKKLKESVNDDHQFNWELEKSSEHASDAWIVWLRKVERALASKGVVINNDLDGDQDVDGYSLDDAHDHYESQWTPSEYADKVIENRMELGFL